MKKQYMSETFTEFKYSIEAFCNICKSEIEGLKYPCIY